MGLVVEVGGRVDFVGPIFDPFVQKSRFGASSFLASAAQKGSESEFNDAAIGLGVIGFDKTFEFLQEVFGWVADVVWKRSDDPGKVDGVLQVHGDVTDDKGGWASSGNDEGIQEQFVFGFISALHFVVGGGQVFVVQSGDEGDEREWRDFVEFLGIFVNLDGFKRFVDFLDVFDELVSSLVLANRVDILSLVVEEERLGLFKVLIFLQVVLKNEFEVIERLGVGWGSNGSRFHFLEHQIHLGEGELGVSINAKDIVDDGASDTDVLGDKAATLDFQIVNSESGGVKNIPGVIIRAVLDRDSGFAVTSWDISALGVAPVLADLGGVAWGVVVVFSGNNDVVSLAVSYNGFFFRDEVVSLGQGDLREVKLKSGGNSSLDVVCPFVNILVQDDSVSLSSGDFDGEGFLKGFELFISLHGEHGWA